MTKSREKRILRTPPCFWLNCLKGCSLDGDREETQGTIWSLFRVNSLGEVHLSSWTQGLELKRDTESSTFTSERKA